MSKYKYSEDEQEINNVLNYQSLQLENIKRNNTLDIDDTIKESEELLKSIGYSLENLPKVKTNRDKPVITVPSWEELCVEAKETVGDNTTLEILFTDEELRNNELYIHMLNKEYSEIHRLDKYDISIAALAGILSATVDILLVGIPKKTSAGIKGGPLSNYVRDWFDKKFPPNEMEKLAQSKISKVPYDAQDNRNTTTYVDGLSSYYHRLLSLGHDPLLGFIFGVFDILTGRMTTIDKNGKIVSQIMENYGDRTEMNIFEAIAKQIIHLKSDITTSMGLPVPLMSLFNLLQFGSIGEAEQTIAEIVQGMYYEGYDFMHFCSMSIPVMITEVIIRIGYAFKRIKEGHSIKESIPFSLDREKHPKLATMLFIGHSSATAINAGKVFFTKNPMAINYPQWIEFAKYSYKQLKWGLLEKPKLQDKYVRGKINEELQEVYEDIDNYFNEFEKNNIIVFE